MGLLNLDLAQKTAFVQLALAAPWSSEDLVLGPVVSWESWTKGSRGSAELRCIWSCLCVDLAVRDGLGRFDLCGKPQSSTLFLKIAVALSPNVAKPTT